MKLSLALHIVGLVFWIGGVILIPRLLKGWTETTEGISVAAAATRRVFFGFVIPGFALALATGLIQFMLGGGMAVYMKQGWFHAKLTFILVAVVGTVILAGELAKAARGEKLLKGRLIAAHACGAVSLFVITLITFLGR